MTRLARWLAVFAAVALAGGAISLAGRSDSPAQAQAPPPGRPFTLRLTFGLTDTAPTVWEGSVRTDARISRIEGWRFLPSEDQVTGLASWRLRTDAAVYPANAPAANRPPVVPNGVLLFGSAAENASLEITTGRGPFAFRLDKLRFGQPLLALNGAVKVERLPATTTLTEDPREDDHPSVAVGPDGAGWAVWQSYSGRQDEVRLRRCEGGVWKTFTRLPGVSGDVWRPQVAIDANHYVWVVWSQQVRGNWDVYARPFDGHQWLPQVRLSDAPLPDINHQVVQAGSGNLCVVWQGFRAGPRPQSDIFLKYYDHLSQRWSPEVQVNSDPANDWDPAVTTDGRDNAWVAWDSYAEGSYDVRLARVRLSVEGSAPGAPVTVAATNRAEMRPTVVCDRQDRVWVAYETARPGWGKDQGYTVRQNPAGAPLGGPREVEVRVLEGRSLREPAAQPAAAFPEGERGFLYTPRLAVDEAGRVWLGVRHKGVRRVRNPQRGVQDRNYWEQWLTRYDGEGWTPPVAMADSTGRQSIYSSLTPGPDGSLWLAWATDNRRYEDLHRPTHTEVCAAFMRAEGEVRPAILRDVIPASSARVPGLDTCAALADGPDYEPGETPVPDRERTRLERRAVRLAQAGAAGTEPAGPKLGEHANEPRDLDAIRSYRARVDGRTNQIVRGDLHRHTEFSWDSGGGGDGSVLDFYRYMIDTASMDYGALTDHNAGGDYEYWWWITEKLADMYHVPGAYVPLFAYERSVTYPNGHRNIIHSYRGVPVVSFFTTPDLTGPRPGIGTGALLDNDTKLLYEEIRKTGGISIPHTTATRMGTDWRDNDRELEPVVEIFQGARTNYEYAGAPKSADPGRDGPHVAQAGYEPAGFVWNAWKKGYRLGTISSSDHGSTHMSYAVVYTPTPTREGILDAIRRRHTYGATDNIILEFRMGDAFMGDEITTGRVPSLRIKVRGTNELARVDVVKNNAVIWGTDPQGRDADLSYRDTDVKKGLSYYYVRVQQKDGQMAWSSPIWVNAR